MGKKGFAPIILLLILTVIVILAFFYLKTNPLKTDKTSENKITYVPGVISVSLQPYVDSKLLNDYVNLHPELSISSNYSIRPYATLSLKPYKEWKNKVASSFKNPQLKEEINNANEQLKAIFETMKDNPILIKKDTNFWATLYPTREADDLSNFALIHVFFVENITKSDEDKFFAEYPQLDIVEDHPTKNYYLIKVPQGKEQYWVTEFKKLEFINDSYLEPKSYPGHITF